MSGTVALRTGSAVDPGGGGRSQLERAVLTVYEAKSTKEGGGCGAQIGSLPIQFNPKELTVAKSAKWTRKPAKGPNAGPAEFTGADPCKLTVELFFDASEKHDGSVVTAVEALLACCVPTDSSRQGKLPSPPLVIFSWGQVTAFPAFITSVSAKYTVFAADGTPIRATCAVAMEEMPVAVPGQNPTSGTLVSHRRHRLVDGDTLAALAWTEYGDPGLWRVLAESNGIDDPTRLRIGSVLMLPELDDVGIPA